MLRKKLYSLYKKLGPGILWAGTAIGISELVQATIAGAQYGYSLIPVTILIVLLKYPFFEAAPRYAALTGKTLLYGYYTQSHLFAKVYGIITLATAIPFTTAVLSVTAGVGTYLFSSNISYNTLGILLVVSCTAVVYINKYSLIDGLMKFVVILLTLSTAVAAVSAALKVNHSAQIVPPEGFNFNKIEDLKFMCSYLSWTPAAIELSVVASFWFLLQKQNVKGVDVKSAILDCRVGYATTIFVTIMFILLGKATMFGTGQSFSSDAVEFASQLNQSYQSGLGVWSKYLIGVAAMAAMLSTLFGFLDGLPRVMSECSVLLLKGDPKKVDLYRRFWLMFLSVGSCAMFLLQSAPMMEVINICTLVSFFYAPLLAVFHYRVMFCNKNPIFTTNIKLWKTVTIIGILFFICINAWYVKLYYFS